MVEFGEKIKQLREEKGMTQQTLAGMLYVTRQAVSRWECGARYPDLLTTKKIANILNVTIDELVSGEALKENIEKEPVFTNKTENTIQIVLYTVAVISSIVTSFSSIFTYVDNYIQSSVVQITILEIINILEYLVILTTGIIGIIFSMNNKLTARLTGVIMSVPYFFNIVSFFGVLIYIHGTKGQLTTGSWFTGMIIPLVFAIYILLYFNQKERRLPFSTIGLIGIYSIGMDLYIMIQQLSSIYKYELAEPSFIFRCKLVDSIGVIAMASLLIYQAYKWNKKKLVAIQYQL